MELGFERKNECRSAGRRQRRLNRASWWFNRMREVVDHALDWEPLPQARPQQVWLELPQQSRSA
jgi:hypothetical protein